jgi:hypothetical protein
VRRAFSVKSGKSPAGKSGPSPAIEAVRLLGKWTLLAQRHLAVGGTCSCCMGFGDARVQDFEQQILDFLNHRHGAKPGIAALLSERAGYRPTESGSLSDLLRSIATQPESKPAEEIIELLSELGRSLDSIEELHR